jgi:crotonobetainyl-CoA:carnitine CoA-transferase CaiB-like acyl-CoA transferase
LDELLEDKRYLDANLRYQNRESLAEAIEKVTSTDSVEHWIAVLDEAGVPCAPIQDFGQVFNDPSLVDRDYFWDATHPTLGKVRQLGSPMRFSATPVRRDKAGPRLGEDSVALLTELGYNDDQSDELLRGRVVGAPERRVPQ